MLTKEEIQSLYRDSQTSIPSTIKKLNFQNKNLNSDDIRRLCEFLGDELPKKRAIIDIANIELDLRNNTAIDQMAFNTLVDTIKKNYHIKKISLDNDEYQKRIDTVIDQVTCDCYKCEYKRDILNNEFSYYSNNWVIIRVWFQKESEVVKSSKLVLYYNAIKTGQVGHVSLQTSDHYVSFWPRDTLKVYSSLFGRQEKSTYHTLMDDFLSEGRIADFSTVLHTVNTNLLNQYYEKIKQKAHSYSLKGPKSREQTDNCSSLVVRLLASSPMHIDGFSTNLLTAFEKIYSIDFSEEKLYSPSDVAELVVKCKEQEIEFLRFLGAKNQELEVLDILESKYFLPQEIEKKRLIKIRSSISGGSIC